ncbi:MAG: hypothetical protein RDV48_29770 [Candidatus Eremiobacteraeota bacterium]|nr:hypothetical protein [Candidatus Eremiobacteraeota bacterium]
MDMRKQITALYVMIKTMFEKSDIVDNNTIVGLIREQVANQLLDFFPEPRDSGWICDREHKYTGQVDLIMRIRGELRIPSVLFGLGSGYGYFANQVIAAFEVKSNISSQIEEIISKTWECHRLHGGFDKNCPEEYDGVEYDFVKVEWVPMCVIGSKGFKDSKTYEKHFVKGVGKKYSIDAEEIERPIRVNDIIPDIIIDFGGNSMIIHKEHNPEMIEKALNLKGSQIDKRKDFTFFRGLDEGQSLIIMLYYLDIFRSSLSVTQFTERAPLLKVFRRTTGGIRGCTN